jgi:hypothetical protein
MQGVAIGRGMLHRREFLNVDGWLGADTCDCSNATENTGILEGRSCIEVAFEKFPQDFNKYWSLNICILKSTLPGQRVIAEDTDEGIPQFSMTWKPVDTQQKADPVKYNRLALIGQLQQQQLQAHDLAAAAKTCSAALRVCACQDRFRWHSNKSMVHFKLEQFGQAMKEATQAMALKPLW